MGKQSLEERLQYCKELSQLQKSFSIEELLYLFKTDGVLVQWLDYNKLNYQANILSSCVDSGDDAILLKLVEVLELDVTQLSDEEAEWVVDSLQREQKRQRWTQECGNDGIIATDQHALSKALDNNHANKIYLCDGIFSIPLDRENIMYDGRGNALINIYEQDEILDFDSKNIYFYNMTIVFHYLKPSQVKADHSGQNHNHFVFLDANWVNKDKNLNKKEVINFLNGRERFETEQDFIGRSNKMHGIIIGTVCLKDTDYDLQHEAFYLNPVWRVEFIKVLREYINGASVVINIPCAEAKTMFSNERVQLVYADFTAKQYDVAIKRLYLCSENGKTYPLYRVQDPTSWCFGSGSGCLEYGLELIDDFS